jgi:hypothetical protein
LGDWWNFIASTAAHHDEVEIGKRVRGTGYWPESLGHACDYYLCGRNRCALQKRQMGIVETKGISADASLMQCQNKKANGNNWRDGRTLGRLMKK